MIEIFLSILMIGYASQYAPGKMESVIAVRQTPGKTSYTITRDLSVYDGFIAMENCNQLGNEYYLRPLGTRDWEFFLVVDCSGHTETSEWMWSNNIIVEVDHETAKRWSTLGKGIKVELAKEIYRKQVP